MEINLRCTSMVANLVFGRLFMFYVLFESGIVLFHPITVKIRRILFTKTLRYLFVPLHACVAPAIDIILR